MDDPPTQNDNFQIEEQDRALNASLLQQWDLPTDFANFSTNTGHNTWDLADSSADLPNFNPNDILADAGAPLFDPNDNFLDASALRLDTSTSTFPDHQLNGLNSSSMFTFSDNTSPLHNVFQHGLPPQQDAFTIPKLPHMPTQPVPSLLLTPASGEPLVSLPFSGVQPLQNGGPYYTAPSNGTPTFDDMANQIQPFANHAFESVSPESTPEYIPQHSPACSTFALPSGQTDQICHWQEDNLRVLAQDWCALHALPENIAGEVEQRLWDDRQKHAALSLAGSSGMLVSQESGSESVDMDMEVDDSGLYEEDSDEDESADFGKKPKKSKKPKPVITLQEPLSVLCMRQGIQPRNVREVINRSTRRQEAAEQLLRVHKLEWRDDRDAPRPSNCFMLYRLAYAPVTKQVYNLSEEAHVSGWISASWHIETAACLRFFRHTLDEEERAAHRLAFPNYPSYNTKHRKDRKAKRGLLKKKKQAAQGK